MLMNPFLYQVSGEEFCSMWKDGSGKPMSPSTLFKRRKWAKENYPKWYLVFLPNNRIDVREWQKMYSAYAEYKWEQKKDPRLRMQ